MNPEEEQLIALAATGDDSAVGQLMNAHAERLKRMISARMDHRLRARIDQSDVFQELQVEAFKRFSEYVENRDMPFFNWLRFLGLQKLAELTRFHLHTQARDVRREVRQDCDQSSMALTEFLVSNVTSPSWAIARDEIHRHVVHVIESLDESDCEILLLRHDEQLSTAEAAVVLGITTNTCRQRHIRALKRLKVELDRRQLDFSSV